MRCIVYGTLAAGALFVANSGSALAQDVIRLGNVGGAQLQTLQSTGGATTQPVLFGLFRHGRFGWHGYYGGGWCHGSYCFGYSPYRSYGYGGYSPYVGTGYGYGYGGYSPYVGTGYGYGGYLPYVGTGYGYGCGGYSSYVGTGYGTGYGGYSPYVGYGYGGYTPYVGSGYGYGYGGYTPYVGSGYGNGGYSPFSSYGFGGVYPTSYNHCAGYVGNAPPVMNLGAPQIPPTIPPQNGNQTFPYDGGPNSLPSIPSGQRQFNTNPSPQRQAVPRDGRLVSLPRETSGFVYPIFASAARSSSTTQPLVTQPRYSYPAYGEKR